MTFEEAKKIYQEGLNDAWDAARKIILSNDQSLDCSELYVIFNTDIPHRIFETFSASEAVEKIKEYEDRQKPCHSCRFYPSGLNDDK